MSNDVLKQRLADDMKSAMRAKEKERLKTIRMIQAAIKQQEVDSREDVDDAGVIAILDKMSKQRKDSIAQFEEAGRTDLPIKKKAELEIIRAYLPQPLTESEIAALIEAAISEVSAESMKDMGKVMAIIKPQAQGRTDMGKLSGLVKAQLTN